MTMGALLTYDVGIFSSDSMPQWISPLRHERCVTTAESIKGEGIFDACSRRREQVDIRTAVPEAAFQLRAWQIGSGGACHLGSDEEHLEYTYDGERHDNGLHGRSVIK